MAQKEVPYPQMLDGFAQELRDVIKAIEPDQLKPALMSDILKIYGGIYWMQQLVTMHYNLGVKNYEIQMQTITTQGQKIKDLETKLAGYSERINTMEGKMKKFEGIDFKLLDMALQDARTKHEKRMDT